MVQELIDWGVWFTRERKDGEAPLALGREDGHSKSRIAFSADLTGRATVAALTVRCAQRRKESRGLHYNAGYPDRIDGKEPRDRVLSVREIWVIPPP